MKKWKKMTIYRKALKIANFSIECAEIYLQHKHVEPSFNTKIHHKKHKGNEPCFIGGISE